MISKWDPGYENKTFKNPSQRAIHPNVLTVLNILITSVCTFVLQVGLVIGGTLIVDVSYVAEDYG